MAVICVNCFFNVIVKFYKQNHMHGGAKPSDLLF